MENPDPSPQFPVRLSRRVSVFQALILAAVLIAGSLALFFAARIYNINRLIDQEYEHALAIQRVHVTFQEIVAAADQTEVADGARGVKRLRGLEDDLNREMQSVIARRRDTKTATGGTRDDSALIRELQRLTEEVRTLTARFTSPGSPSRRASDMERLEMLAANGADVAQSLVDLHQDGVRYLLQIGEERLRSIIVLYVILLLVGSSIVCIVGLVCKRWITTPLRRLADATGLVAEGQLDTRVPVGTDDEIGQLSHAFNVMAAQLQDRERNLHAVQEQLRHKVIETHALYQIGTEISGLTQVDPTLRWVVNKARDLLKADAALLCLISRGGDELTVRAASGTESWRMEETAPRHVSLVDSSADVCAAATEFLQPWHAHVAVPLRRADAVLGVLVVAHAAPYEFSSDERELAAGLAAQAALLIDNARLYEEVQGAAALEERRRISRELHDGLAQALGMLYLKIRHLQDRVAKTDDVAGATAGLDELAGLAGSAYDEARQSIFGLRAKAATSQGFVPALTEYLDEFRALSGIPIALEVDAHASLAAGPMTEVHAIRIIQEALHNVRRHAAARRAWVRLARNGGMLSVTVEDDGRGWDLATNLMPPRQHFGLQTMQERAESLGGTLQIDTGPGRGTRVTAILPLETTV